MKLLLYLIAAATIGFNHDKVVEDKTFYIYIDPSASQSLKEQIVIGLDDWETHTRFLHFQLVSQPCYFDNCAVFVPVKARWFLSRPEQAQMKNQIIGLTEGGYRPIRIYIAYDLYNDRATEYLTRHETGHLLGLSHSNKGTVMYWECDGATTNITCTDVAAYYSLWGFPKQPCNIK